MQSIGIFGGTFDPVHLGHLNALTEVDEQCNFSQIKWVLSARPPHKNQTSASIQARFNMLDLALEKFDRYLPDDTEVKRGEYSYTYSTLEQFRRKFPDASLTLIIGGDSIEKIHTWYRYLDLLKFANIVVMNRPGHEAEIPQELLQHDLAELHEIGQYQNGRIARIHTTEYDISSTKIRGLLADSATRDADEVQAMLDPKVYDYIISNKLY